MSAGISTFSSGKNKLAILHPCSSRHSGDDRKSGFHRPAMRSICENMRSAKRRRQRSEENGGKTSAAETVRWSEGSAADVT
ncbi:hypothetical protein [Neorhizobium sp. T7_12]|uniref:hypothetical protein n=1 Tax=Neorhizobium sp. T7_12 TaxID=2093832 RepID=UPI00155E8486|nr:hypothetical protein [Neorhizobium sp. T7_12]